MATSSEQPAGTGREGLYLHVFPSFDAGGAQVRAVELMNMLGSACRHTVVAMDGRRGAGLRLAPGVVVDYLSPPRRAGFLGMGLAFRALLRSLGPDLLLTYNWGSVEALLGARLAGFRAQVHHEDGFGPDEATRFLRRRIWARRVLFRRLSYLVVPSMRLHQVARQIWRFPQDRLLHLPNGVDPERFRPQPAGERPLTVGTVGWLREEKDQALLLRAFAASSLRDKGRLLLVGDGPCRQELTALAAELGIAGVTEFTGALADPLAAYGEMDIFALSSRTEQMPVVLLEAMACGLPLVATAVGDIEAMVAAANTPFLTRDRNPTALAALLDRLADDAPRRREVGAANRQVVLDRYERDACYGRYLQAYDRAVAGGGRGG